MADGRSHTRYWYDASSTVWDSGLVTINGGEAPGDPVISAWAAKVTELGEVTLKGRTDTARGTVYAIVDASPTQPTNEQVRDGLNAAGAPALGKGSAIGDHSGPVSHHHRAAIRHAAVRLAGAVGIDMADRDTTASPYLPSADGLTYFRYPGGNAPVVQVADYAELRTKGSADTSIGRIWVAGQYIAGTFVWSATDPYALGDDGGLVIAATDGWWVRQYKYSLLDPIELDWYENITEDYDITVLLKSIATLKSPFFFVRVPSKVLRIVWDDIDTFLWSSLGILSFAMLEADVPTEFHVASPDTKEFWRIDVDAFLLGSPSRKATYNDYNLTFSSTWTFDNRLFNDSVTYTTPPYGILLHMEGAYPISGACRCNAGKFQGSFMSVRGSQFLDFKLAGKYRYATGVDFSAFNEVDFEGPYCSDELGRKPGWTGTVAGLVDRNIGLVRGGGIGGFVTGNGSGRAIFKGEVFYQYGGGGAFFFIDYIGTSIDDPFVMYEMDRGFTGPNEFGKPVGVQFQQHGAYRMEAHKSDGFGPKSTNETDKRFFKLIASYDTHGPFTSPATGWMESFFIENNQVDDVPGAGLTYTQHVTFICVNLRGGITQENGPPIQGVEQVLDHIHFMGDGVNPAWLVTPQSKVAAWKYNTIKYAQIYNALIGDIGGEILDVTCTGKITVNRSSTWTASNLTFLGSARTIIDWAQNNNVLADVTFSVTNLYAPVGSVIAAPSGFTAHFILDGVEKTLPYTIQAGDNGTPMLAIPANPLLGTA